MTDDPVARWRYDVASRVLTDGEHRLNFTPAEGALVRVLASAQGRFVRHDTVIGLLWEGDGPDGASNALKVVVCRLRAKLAAAGFLAAVGLTWGAGYCWTQPTDLTDPVLVLSAVHAGELRWMLHSHPDQDRAGILRWALFGV